MWKAAQLAIQGEGHIRKQIPCQDKTFILFEKDKIAVALADGAGSAIYSEIGAACVSNSICNNLLKNFDEYFDNEEAGEVANEIINTLRGDLTEITIQKQCRLEDLASTILAVVIKKDHFILIHIGDGVIGCLENDSLKVLSTPDNEEFVNITTFVTSSNVLSHMRLYKGMIDNISAFVLMSDGTASGLYDKRSQELIPAIKRFFYAMHVMDIEELQSQLKLSFQESVCQITDDDCSIILLVDEESEFENLLTDQIIDSDTEEVEILEEDLNSEVKQVEIIQYVDSDTEEVETLEEDLNSEVKQIEIIQNIDSDTEKVETLEEDLNSEVKQIEIIQNIDSDTKEFETLMKSDESILQ